MGRRQLHLLWVAAVILSSGIAELVDFKNVSLTHIPSNQTKNVSELILSHNSIKMSKSDVTALQKYESLKVLDLSHNLINELPSGAFHNLMNLEILYLKGNRLKTLSNDVFKDLIKLKTLDLDDNPWQCSCSLVRLIKQLNISGVSTGENITCRTSENISEKVSDENSSCSVTTTTLKASVVPPTQSPNHSGDSSYVNNSNKEFIAGGVGTPTGSNSWKFLLGVVVMTLSTSMLIVCAVKSPSWYKLLFNYRHQRLREDAEPTVFSTSRYSNFSLDTEQTETSAQEMEEALDHGLSLQPLEDDDGFIEDGYIESGDYEDHTEPTES